MDRYINVLDFSFSQIFNIFFAFIIASIFQAVFGYGFEMIGGIMFCTLLAGNFIFTIKHNNKLMSQS